jgi:signal transduction histidine kinase
MTQDIALMKLTVPSTLLREPQRLVIAATLLAVLTVGAILVLDVQREIARDRAVIEAQLRASTRILEEHAAISLAGAEGAVKRVLDSVQHLGLEGFLEDRVLQHATRAVVAQAEQLAMVALFDASGQALFCTCTDPLLPLNIADRTHFLAHRDGADRYIGSVIGSRIDGRPMFPLSRRLAVDGVFAGVVVATLDVAYFQSFYDKVRREGPLRIAMYRSDGSVLAMQPVPGVALPRSPIPEIAAHLERHRAHTFLDPASPIDNVSKLVSFRNLEAFPIAVAAVYDYSAVMAGAQATVLGHALVFILFVLACVSGVLLIRRALQLRLRLAGLDAEHVAHGRLVNMLAHDLRGPLAASRMGAQMLLGARTAPEQVSRVAERIEASVGRAQDMIDNLLDVHRLRARQDFPLNLQRCDLAAIVREATEDLPDAERNRLVLRGPESLVGWWDANLLRRALWNLISNAMKYGDRDTPVEIELGVEDHAAWVRVHNWGLPIPREEQRTIFEPFARTRASERGEQPGWGLGLCLVEGVAAAHDGTVTVASDAASGTTFTLRLDHRLPMGQVGAVTAREAP